MVYNVLCCVECAKHVGIAANSREEAEKKVMRMFEGDAGKVTFAKIVKPTFAIAVSEYEEEELE